MTFLRAITISITFALLCTSTALVSATEQTSSAPILGLINASQERSQDHTLKFWGQHDSQGSSNYADTLRLR